MARFKNDNRANASLVIEHTLREVEKNLEKLTGKRVKLSVEEGIEE